VFSKDELEASVLREGICTRESLNGVGYELLAVNKHVKLTHRLKYSQIKIAYSVHLNSDE
jgi:hypothetical protein